MGESFPEERTVNEFYRIYSNPVFVRRWVIYLLEKGEQERWEWADANLESVVGG